MPPLVTPTGRAIYVPGWAVVAAITVIGLLSAGYAAGQKGRVIEDTFTVINYRLCRIEHAVNVEPYMTCTQP